MQLRNRRLHTIKFFTDKDNRFLLIFQHSGKCRHLLGKKIPETASGIMYGKKSVIVRYVETEGKVNDIIDLFNKTFINRIEVVRGGSVAIEAVSTTTR